jgi:hypothetical protein
VAHNAACWVNIVASLQIDAMDLISSHIDNIKSDIKNASSVSPVSDPL